MVNGIRDGMTIPLPHDRYAVQAIQTNQIYQIERNRDTVFKLVTNYFFEAARELFTYRNVEPPGIRPTDEDDYPENADRLSAMFPDLGRLSIPPHDLHFLLLHKLQYERIKKQFAIHVPDAAFVLTPSSPRPRPTIVQRAVDGRSLLDKLGEQNDVESGLAIACQLHGFEGSPHVDWAPGNFIWSGTTLFYVDSKPTFFRTERRNEQHKERLRSRFIRPFRKSIPGYQETRKGWWIFR